MLWGNDVLLRLCAHIPVWLLRPAVWISLTVAVLDQIGSAVLVQQYPGDVPVCFYLTDRKKMLSLRGGQAMAVQPESYAALCRLVPPEQIGFLPAK